MHPIRRRRAQAVWWCGRTAVSWGTGRLGIRRWERLGASTSPTTGGCEGVGAAAWLLDWVWLGLGWLGCDWDRTQARLTNKPQIKKQSHLEAKLIQTPTTSQNPTTPQHPTIPTPNQPNPQELHRLRHGGAVRGGRLRAPLQVPCLCHQDALLCQAGGVKRCLDQAGSPGGRC